MQKLDATPGSTASTDEAPPKLGDFGLTEEIVQSLEKQRRGKLSQDHSVGRVALVITACLFLLLLLFRPSELSVGAAVWVFIVLFLFVMAGVVGVYNFSNWISSVDKDPNQRAYMKFRCAVSAYEQRVAKKEAECRANEVAEEAKEKRAKKEYWFSLTGHEFENQLALLYRRLGYEAAVTRGSGDEGVDIRLSKGNEKMIVQCKAHKRPMGPGAVRELYGTLLHEEADIAIIVSLGGFTAGASSWARGKPIKMEDVDYVLAMEQEVAAKDPGFYLSLGNPSPREKYKRKVSRSRTRGHPATSRKTP